MGATMGSMVGLTIGFIFGTFAILKSVPAAPANKSLAH